LVDDDAPNTENFSLQYDFPLPLVCPTKAVADYHILFQILDTNPTLYFRLQQQKLIEYIRQGRIVEALQFAQEELALRGQENPEFLSELESTMALLAFDSSASAPQAISSLLSPHQRMKTAGEVNAAILESLSQGKESKLVSLLKLLCWGESMLDERAEFPKVCLSPCLLYTHYLCEEDR
jgi:glucose-induced degradation protein 8